MDAGDLRVCEYRGTCGKGCAALRSDPGIVLLSADACGIQSLAGSGFLSDRTDGRGYA